MVRFGLAIAGLVLLNHVSNACSVPVFRYALEQWPASRYELLVFHRGPLSPDESARLRQFSQSLGSANLTVREVDLSGDVGNELRTIWDAEVTGAALPRLILRYPDSSPKLPSAWSGPFNTLRTSAITDSPARRAIFNHLTAGRAAVLVFVLSGDLAADQAAREMLRKQVPSIASAIELPAPTAEGPQVQSAVSLSVSFPVVEVARTAEERLLVDTLLRSEEGLRKVRGPVLFPVFGRGRALCALHGPDIESPGELKNALNYICRACSCQAKELNPGVDLLISGDWDAIFTAQRGPMPRAVDAGGIPGVETKPSGTGGLNTVEMRPAPPQGYSTVETVTEKAPRRVPIVGRFRLLGAICFAIVAGLWIFRRRQPRHSGSP